MSAALKGAQIYFGPFLVTSQVFHLTPLSFALVNLKPILPGHVLVSPRRRVPRVADLTAAETTDLFLTVQRVGKMVERVAWRMCMRISSRGNGRIWTIGVGRMRCTICWMGRRGI
ncbi:hypothetical protein CNMCM5623_001841 [Aspergillus felis]|uniref:HIT domain-containing protein n=1 Tax=Aspergillus felis TaxID=1287682 RepID=A0A8H6QAQ4_9EURO|nr:hypothetical protein CNMCM5623_001841 [Aspergillus felis]